MSSYPVQLVVESAGVADGLPGAVPPPQRRRGRVAVGALGALSPLGVLHGRRERGEVGEMHTNNNNRGIVATSITGGGGGERERERNCCSFCFFLSFYPPCPLPLLYCKAKAGNEVGSEIRSSVRLVSLTLRMDRRQSPSWESQSENGRK